MLTNMTWTTVFLRQLKLRQFLHFKSLPRRVVLKQCSTLQTWGSKLMLHRWQHNSAGALQWSHSLIQGCRCTSQSARFLSAGDRNLCQREDKIESDSELTYIESELAAENKFSKRQKRSATDLRNTVVNVGRFVPDKVLELLDENGTSLGTVNRDQAVVLSQEKKLKLVLLKPQAKPWPLYKLMTGQELHQEQVKRNEKVKKKTAPTQVKEVKTSWNIGDHDLQVRRRQLENWFSDSHSHVHVRVTVTGGKALAGTMKDGTTDQVSEKRQEEVTQQLMKVVTRLLSGLEDRITLNGPPQLTGKNLTTLKVTLRAMSAKEKAAHKKSIPENVANTK